MISKAVEASTARRRAGLKKLFGGKVVCSIGGRYSSKDNGQKGGNGP